MGDSARRATGRAALLTYKNDIQLRFRGKDYKDNLQLDCMVPNGSEHVVHDLQLHLQLHPGHTLVHLDVTNAFNTQHRYAFLKQVHEHFPRLLPLCAQFYAHDSDLLIWGRDGKLRILKSSSGQQQGDTLGSFLFCLGIHPILEAAHQQWPALLIRAICDDIHMAGPDEDVAAAFVFIRRELEKIGLQLKYGPKKTCCLLPGLPAGDDDETVERRRLLGRRASLLPPEVVRLGGGMEVLGSFVGSDDWVRAAALAKVEDAVDAKSIKYACTELARLAASEARNARDIAGSLLRVCVIAKLGYLCRTVRPDLLLPAARAADDLVARAFCSVFHINTAIFSACATAEQRLAATRARLPTSLSGAGLRSAVTISNAGYFASLRAVAPAIAASSSPAAAAALRNLSAETERDPLAPPMLRAVATTSRELGSVARGDDAPLTSLETFCEKPPSGLQRTITHAVEAQLHDRAIAAARPDAVFSAFLKRCDGRWVRTLRLAHLQLSNEEATLRMQRYLRQPLSVLAGIVGKRGLDVKHTIIDQHGDALLSGYKAPGDNEHTTLHNVLCRLLSTFASQSHVSNVLEGGKVRGTKKKPGDVRFRGDAGSHGWAPAGNRELWADVTVVCPVLPTYVDTAAATRGAAAAKAAQHKRNKYRNDIPGLAFFLPLAFETEGYHTDDLDKLLLGFARKRAVTEGMAADQLKQRAGLWKDYWLNEIAIVHARYVARCILHRAASCKDVVSPPFRRASYVDVAAATLLRTPLPLPPPPPPPLSGTASAPAPAPAH